MATKAKRDSQKRIENALSKHGLNDRGNIHPIHWTWYALAAVLCIAGAWWQWVDRRQGATPAILWARHTGYPPTGSIHLSTSESSPDVGASYGVP